LRERRREKEIGFALSVHGVEFGFWFLIRYATKPLALQLHQERLQVVCSERVSRKRLAQRHFCNGPWT